MADGGDVRVTPWPVGEADAQDVESPAF